jgi:hypothetical protein
MELAEIQGALDKWGKRNFPTSTDTEDFEGAVEELGELSKIRLKRKQNIRRNIVSDGAEMDAVADLTIYLIQYCSKKGWDFETLLTETAIEVMKRDWIMYPTTGRPPAVGVDADQDPAYKRLRN